MADTNRKQEVKGPEYGFCPILSRISPMVPCNEKCALFLTDDDWKGCSVKSIAIDLTVIKSCMKDDDE